MYQYLLYYQLHPKRSWADGEEVENLLASLGTATRMHPNLIRLDTEDLNVHAVHTSIGPLFTPRSGNVYYLTEIPEFTDAAGHIRLARFTNLGDGIEIELDEEA